MTLLRPLLRRPGDPRINICNAVAAPIVFRRFASLKSKSYPAVARSICATRARFTSKFSGALCKSVSKKQGNAIDRQVGNRVRLRRMLMGISQEHLGKLLGLTFQQVQKYEKGVNRIGAGRLFEISRILGVPIMYFFEEAAVQEAESLASEALPPIMDFVSSGEGLQLSLAFMKLKDPKLRRRVLNLVKQMAEDSIEHE